MGHTFSIIKSKRIFCYTVQRCNLTLTKFSNFLQNYKSASCFSTIFSPICSSLTKGNYYSYDPPFVNPLVSAGLQFEMSFKSGRASMVAISRGKEYCANMATSNLRTGFACCSTCNVRVWTGFAVVLALATEHKYFNL